MRALVAHLTLASLLLGATPLPAQQISDPELYDKSLLAARQALEVYGRWDDEEQHRRVLDIGYRLADASGFDDFPFTFYLIDMAVPNAFALPGGQIFLTRGMLDLDLNDDMLAGLLGHEIGHVTQRHGMRMQKRATLLNVLAQALLVGVIVAASQSSGRVDPHDPYARETNKVEGAAATGMVVSELLLRGYSREFEDEADLEGQRMAAASGFDPDGTRQLMAKMGVAIPQTKEYGYWNTHPFFDERVQAADARRGTFRIADAAPADEYRRRTQAVLLDYAVKADEEARAFLEEDALAVWPVGARAEELRLARLHAARDAVLAEPELSRDLGDLLGRYQRHLDEVRRLTPASTFIATLTDEMAGLREQREALYPRFLETFEGGVYETDFLETFVSNYPDAGEAPGVALTLGQYYSRLGRQADAVDHYLRAAEEAPDGSDVAEKARRGLRTLAGLLEDLTALQRLADQEADAELATLAGSRLAERVPKYAQLANGAAYLAAYPHAERAEAVNERLHLLADNLYGEVVLYQAVGDSAKAVQGIQEILKYAPLSPAAQRLRNQMVLEG